MIKTKEALSQTKLTRRQFLRGAAVSTAGFMLVPSLDFHGTELT